MSGLGLRSAAFLGVINSEKYWIGTLSAATSLRYGNTVVDADDNFYNSGDYADGSSISFAVLQKYDKNANIIWQKSMGGGTDGFDVVIDSSSNLYLGYAGSDSPYESGITKYNNSGTLQWQKSFTGEQNFLYYMAIDSSSNVYTVGEYYPSPGNQSYGIIVKINSSGTIQYQKSFDNTYSDYVGFYNTAVTSSNEAIVVGYATTSAVTNGYSGFIIKLDSSGAISWQKYIDRTNYAVYVFGVTRDSNNNIYVGAVFYDLVGNDDYIGLLKFDSSGTLQWERKLTGSSLFADLFTFGLAVDLNDNVYIPVRDLISAKYVPHIVKYNSSGTIQWQRRLTSSQGGILYLKSVTSKGMYVSGATESSPDDALFAKLPLDGSKTGTYSVGGISFTYEASSLTDAAGSSTVTTSDFTATTISLTASTSTYTDATTSFTSSVTQI